MNPAELSPDRDDPVDGLMRFHRRAERELAALGRLPALLESAGCEAHAAHAAAQVLACFGQAAPRHHAAEERELLPLIERRIPEGGARQAFQALRRQLEADHREIERVWRTLRRPLEAIAEGVPRRLPIDDIRYYRALFATHISAEESALHLLALRHLTRDDRARLAHRLGARPAVTKASPG